MDNNHCIEKIGDNIYVNVVFNHTDNSTFIPTPAIFNVTKTLPILSKADDYYVSIIRFTIPLATLPLYIFPIVPNSGSTAPQPSPLFIGITTPGGTDFPEQITYVPDNSLFPIVNQNNPLKQIITPYYYVYTYQLLLNRINVALNNAFIAASSPGAGVAPFFYLNSTTNLISLVVSKAFVTSGAKIFGNDEILAYIEGIEIFFFDFNSPSNHAFNFVLNTTPNFDFYFNTMFPTPSDYNIYTQEYSTLAAWSSLRNIIITSNTIPVLNEFIPISGTSQEVSSSLPIITDFNPDIERGGDSRSVAYYYPTSQYRLVDLISSRPIQSIDLRLLWQDRVGNIYPITIGKNQTANVKLVFVRKDLYKSGQIDFLKK